MEDYKQHGEGRFTLAKRHRGHIGEFVNKSLENFCFNEIFIQDEKLLRSFSEKFNIKGLEISITKADEYLTLFVEGGTDKNKYSERINNIKPNINNLKADFCHLITRLVLAVLIEKTGVAPVKKK